MTYSEFMILIPKQLVEGKSIRAVRVRFLKVHAGLRWFQAFYDKMPELPPTRDQFDHEGRGRIRMIGVYPEIQFLPEEDCYKLGSKKRRRICYKCKVAVCPLDMAKVS